MSLTYTPKPFANGFLSGASATLYTNATTGGAIIKEIILCNTGTVQRTVTLYVVPSGQSAGAAYAICSLQAIDPSGTLVLALGTVMANGDKIAGFADLANVVSIRVSGVEAA